MKPRVTRDINLSLVTAVMTKPDGTWFKTKKLSDSFHAERDTSGIVILNASRELVALIHRPTHANTPKVKVVII